MRAARQLSREFLQSHPGDAALILENLSAAEAGALLEELPSPVAALVLRNMVSVSGAECLARISDEKAGPILGGLPSDAAAALLLRVDAQERDRLLSRTPPKAAEALRRRLRYPEGTAGALMDSRVLSFSDHVTAGQALSRVRRSYGYAHYYVYVVDRQGRLVGVLNLRKLMLARPEQSLASAMNPQVVRLADTADRPAILAHPGWREVHALPVVDTGGRFMGVVRHETVRRLELETAADRGSGDIVSAGLAFADLCWIGMTQVLGGLATALQRQAELRQAAGGDHHG